MYLDSLKGNKLFEAVKAIVDFSEQASAGSKINSKLDELDHVAIACFERSVQDKLQAKAKQSCADSVDHDYNFKFADSDIHDHKDSFAQTPDHRNKSMQFSIALSRIPDQKMSNLSIMDFKDILRKDGGRDTFNGILSPSFDGPKPTNRKAGTADIDDGLDQFAADTSLQSSGKRDSIARSQSDPDRQATQRGSLFAPNQPVPRHESHGYCCRLV